MTYALIIADPSTTALGEIVSRHRTTAAAGHALRGLANPRYAYVAARRADGSYPHRIEALRLPAHAEAIEAGDRLAA